MFRVFTRYSLLCVTAALLVAGCAIGPVNYRQSISSAVQGSGYVTVEIRGDTVILRGSVEDKVSEKSALRAAKAGEGIRRVINYIHVSYE